MPTSTNGAYRTRPPHLTRILSVVAAELEPLLAARQTGRITLNISAGGGVRLEVAHFTDIARSEGE